MTEDLRPSNHPLISVIIPCFNSSYLQECVNSVLSQTYENFEIIVVDCSSNKATIEVVDRLNHSKVKIFRREKQHLPGSNRNYGIERAAGEFILCLDADDIIERTFLEEAAFLICCTDYSLIGTSFRTIGFIERTIKVVARPTLTNIANGDAYVVTMLLRKDLWRSVGGFVDNALGQEHCPEDWDFFVKAMALGATIYNRGSYGFIYRKHWSSITAQPDMPKREKMKKRIFARHKEKIEEALKAEQDQPIAVFKDGWRQMLTERHRGDRSLCLLPEQVNDAFIERLRHWLSSHREILTAVATCEVDAYPSRFLELFAEYKAELFCLPDFLGSRDLWPEFVAYLQATRQIQEVLYGQNPTFLEMLPSFAKAFPNSVLTYIPRYRQQNEALSG